MLALLASAFHGEGEHLLRRDACADRILLADPCPERRSLPGQVMVEHRLAHSDPIGVRRTDPPRSSVRRLVLTYSSLIYESTKLTSKTRSLLSYRTLRSSGYTLLSSCTTSGPTEP